MVDYKHETPHDRAASGANNLAEGRATVLDTPPDKGGILFWGAGLGVIGANTLHRDYDVCVTL